MSVRYKPAPYGVFNQLMNAPELVEVMREVAKKGIPFAESISPERTGEYRASFEVTAHAHGGLHGDRAEAQLINTSEHAVNVEWQDNYHVLARTADELKAL